MNIGACWIKEKDGKTYLSGQIRTPGLDLNFSIFKNSEKNEGSNQPDYNIVWYPPKNEKSDKPAGESPFDDKNVPF